MKSVTVNFNVRVEENLIDLANFKFVVWVQLGGAQKAKFIRFLRRMKTFWSDVRGRVVYLDSNVSQKSSDDAYASFVQFFAQFCTQIDAISATRTRKVLGRTKALRLAEFYHLRYQLEVFGAIIDFSWLRSDFD